MFTLPVDSRLGTIRLADKPNAALRYNFLPGDLDSKALVVFLNGLILPQSSWRETISQIAIKTEGCSIPRPHLLSYDRYGQGLSDKAPNGLNDISGVVKDLQSFLQEFEKEKQLTSESHGSLIFVANSIGCAIARLFAAAHPDKVSGFIFLDSMMAHVDLVALWPDPDDSSFDERLLPKGTTIEQLREVKKKYKKIFHVHAPNPEDLDRSGLGKLLPSSDSPKLGTVDGAPWITVVGHDPDTFAEENEKSFGVPQALVNKYVNPFWHGYNQGLARLTDEDKSKGPVIAKGCGHFIQRDDPAFVADEVCELLQKLHA